MSASASVVALTTTFTPAASCTQLMFSAPAYMVWFNEPVPMPSSTLTGCYPTEFLNGYASASSSSSIAPMMSPLVCPDGWTTAWATSTSYIACCPTSYALHYPDTTVDTKRPAYGGTCFSDIASGQTITVTQYTDSSIVQTQTITSTLNGGQAFAHVIDGIMQQAVLQPSQTPAATGLDFDTTAAPVQASATTAPSAGFVPLTAAPTGASISSPESSSLSSGDIAGIAVGATGAVAMIGAILIFLFFRRRGQAERFTQHEYDSQVPPPPPMKDFPYSHSNSLRSTPTQCDEKRSFAVSTSPMSIALAPGRLQVPVSAYQPQHYHQQQQQQSRRDYSELPVEQQHEIYSPSREDREDGGRIQRVEMEGSEPALSPRRRSELGLYEQSLSRAGPRSGQRSVQPSGQVSAQRSAASSVYQLR